MRVASKSPQLAISVCVLLTIAGCQAATWSRFDDAGPEALQSANDAGGVSQAPQADASADTDAGHGPDASVIPPVPPRHAEPCDACDPVALCNESAVQLCRCPSGWLDTNGNGSRCEDVCGKAGCDPHATCELRGSRASCLCAAAYVGDGKTCTERPTCASLVCGEHEACETANDVSSCVCAKGYARSGTECLNVNECLTPNRCSALQECRDLPGAFECVCRTPPNLLADASFEKQTSSAPVAPWTQGPPWDTDPTNRVVVSNAARTGVKSMRMTTKGDWSEIAQRVAVQPGAKYRLRAWFKTDAKMGSAGWLGARKPGVDGSEVGAVSLTTSTAGTFVELVTLFDSTTWHEVEVYLGVMPGSAPPNQVEVDDISLEQVPTDSTCL